MKLLPLVIVATSLLFAVSACTGPTGSDPADDSSQFPVGTCLADFIGVDSDRTTVVECTEAHYFDVLGVDTWPDMAAQVAASDAATVYDAIMGEEPSEISDAYWAWAYERVLPLYLDAIGVTDLSIDGKSTEELGLSVGANTGWDISLQPRDEFVAGDQTSLFSTTWFSVEGEQIQVSHPAGITVIDVNTGSLPAELRQCFTRDPDAEEKYTDTDCTKSHNGQYLAFVDAGVALGAEFVASADPDSTLFANYEPLDEYCTILLDTLYPGLLDSPNWSVWSDQLSNQLGWETYDGTVDPALSYPVYCAILTPEGKTLAGDVISGEVNVSVSIG